MGALEAMANINVTKSTITEELNNLRRFGFEVMNFNHNDKMPAGARDMTDYLITGKDKVFWIEAKLGRDKLTEGQRRYMNWIIRISERLGHRTVYWFLITEENYIRITDMLFNRQIIQIIKSYEL